MSAIRRIAIHATLLLFFSTLIFLPSQIHAQAPEGINYQAVARDQNGNVITGTQIQVQFSILEGSSSGTVVYQELHTDAPGGGMLVTNDFGHFNLVIGDGVQNGGTAAAFSDIGWGSNRHFIKVELAVGANPLETLGTTELVSVPYALYAKRAGNNFIGKGNIQINGDTIENVGDTSSANELVTQFILNGSNELVLQEGSNIPMTVDLAPIIAGNDSLNIDSVRNDLVYLSIIGGNQVLFSVQDDDADAFNEIQVLSLNGSNDSLVLSRQGGAVALSDLGVTDNQGLDYNATRDSILIDRGAGIDIGHLVDTVELNKVEALAILDSSATNELVDSMDISGNFLRYYQQGMVDSVDLGLDTIGIVQRLALFARTNANRQDIDSLQKNFSADSTLLRQHLIVDQDFSDLNERVDSMDINGSFLRVFENGTLSDSVNLSSIIPAGTDTSIVSGSIVGDSIILVNNVGQTIEVNISNLATDSELSTEVGKLSVKMASDSTVLANRIQANTDSIGSVLDSLNNHIALDRDTGISNERNLDFSFDGSTNILSIRDTAGTLAVNLSALANVTGIDTVSSVALINDNELRIYSGDGDSATVDISSLATDADLATEVSILTSKILNDSIAQATRINQNLLSITANAQGIIDSTNNLQAALLARINADSLSRYINDTTLNGQLRDTSAVLRAIIASSGSDDQLLSFNTNQDTILLEDGGFISIKDIRDSIANYNARINANVLNISNNQSAIAANAQGIIDSTNNLQVALLARINADSLSRYINDTTLNGQLRDTSAVLRTLISSTNTDDQQLSFNTNQDTILLEDGGFISIKDIRDSIANYNTRINTNQTDIGTNQTAIASNAQGIIDSTNNLQAALLARINADSLLRYVNDTTLNGQLRDTSAVLRTLIAGTNTDNQMISFNAAQDTILLEDGGSISIKDIRDSIANYNTRINTNQTDIGTNQTAIVANAQGIIDSTNNLQTTLLARINADSLLRYVNDTTLNGQLRDTSAVLRTLIAGTNTDNQMISFNAAQDTILLEDGGFISIKDIRDSIANYNTRINTNRIDIGTNANAIGLNSTDIGMNQTAIGANTQAIIDTATAIRGEVGDTSALLRGLISTTNTDNQNLSFLSSDSIKIDNGNGIDVSRLATDAELSADSAVLASKINADSLVHAAKGNANMQAIIDTATAIRGEVGDTSALLRGLISTTNTDNQNLTLTSDSIKIDNANGINITALATDAELSADSAVLASKINADSLVHAAKGNANMQAIIDTATAIRGEVGDTSALLRGLISTANTDDQKLTISAGKGTITLEDGGNIVLNDSSETNEIQSLSFNSGTNQLTLSDPTINPVPIDLSSLVDDADASITNERIDSIDVNGEYIRFFENGTLSDSVSIASHIDESDTNIVSGSIVGTNIRLVNDKGNNIDIPISSLATDAEVSADSLVLANKIGADSLVHAGRITSNTTNIATNAINISNNSSMLSTMKTNFTADSTALQDHLTDDLDISTTNERVDSMDVNGNFLRIFENGTLSDSANLSSFNNSSPFSTTSGVTSNVPGDQATDDFVFGSPSLDNSGNANHFSRMFFDKSLSAFRAGNTTGFQWNASNIGQYSAAFGTDTQVDGQYSFAAGDGSIVSGKYSAAFGQDGTINSSATHSFAMGLNNVIGSSAIANIAMGSGDSTDNIYSIALGHLNTANGNRSLAMGSWLRSNATGAFVIGVGIDNSNRIVNNISNSLMVGFNSTVPTLFVSGGNGAGTLGEVGIGTTTPDSLLDVAGGASIDRLNINSSYTFPTTDGTNGQILQTDGSGNVTWQTPSSGTDDQNISISAGKGTIALEDGGSIQLADSSATNEIQSISRTASTVTLSNGGGTFTDSTLTEATVDGFVSNNGFLTTEVDGSVTNELQDLSINGAMDSLLISNGMGVKLSDIQGTNDTISLIRSTDKTRYVETENTGEIVFGVNGSDRFKIKENNIEFAEKTVLIGQSSGTNQTFGSNIDDSTANIAIGNQAMMTNATSRGEIAIGSQALMNSGSSASFNVAIGSMAAKSNDNGTGITAIGNAALKNMNSNSSNNTVIGNSALGNATNGAGNTALGSGAGTGLTIGNDNIFIGTNSGASGTYSDKLFIDVGNGSLPLIYGDLAEDSLVINGVLTIDSMKDGSGYTFPGIDGSANQVLRTDGGGKAYWSTVTADGNGIFSGSGSLSGSTEVIGGSNPLSFTSSLQNAVLFDTTTLVVDAANNRVGVGIATPLAGMHVESADSVAFAVDQTFMGTGLSTALRVENLATNSLRRYAGQFISNSIHTQQNLGLFSYAGSADTVFAIQGVADGSGNAGSQAIGGILTASGAILNYGLIADAESVNPSDSAVGVYGSAFGAGTNFAGFFDQGNVFIGDSLVIPTGAGLGKVLTSDADGKAIWQSQPSSIKGTGVINKLAYFAAADSIVADNDLHWDASNKRLGIGMSTPSAKLCVWDTVGATSGTGINSFLYTNNGSNLYGLRTQVEHTNLSSDTAFGLHSYVYGSAGSITKYGVYSKAAGGAFADYYGVYGSGIGQNNSYGLYGSATGSNNNYGVYGTASGGTGNNWAGYFDNGDVYINDTLRLNNPFTLGDNAGSGKVLTSDANGVATWQTLASSTDNQNLSLNVSKDSILIEDGTGVSLQHINDSINNLRTSITINGGNISTNASNILSNSGSITSNSSQIATNTSNISTNTGTIGSNSTAISTNTSNISTNTTNISSNAAAIAADTDGDATNETNTAFQVNGANLEITDASGTLTVPLTSLNTGTDDQTLSISGGKGTISIEDGNSIVLADSSATNELQDLSINGAMDSLLLSNGMGVKLSSLNIADTLSIVQDADRDTKIRTQSVAGTDADTISFDINGNTEFQFNLGGQILTNNSNSSTYIGQEVGNGNGTFGNNVMGFQAFQSNQTSFNNVAIGTQTMGQKRGGLNSTAVGAYSLRLATTGSWNTALGYAAGRGNITDSLTGTQNVYLGAEAGFNAGSGSNNVAVGFRSGYNLGTGSNNIFIGNQAGLSETGSNKLYIENSSSGTPLIYGDFSADSAAINGKLTVGGALNVNSAFTFPTTDGTANQVLQTDGSGNVSWGSVSGDNLGNHTATTNLQIGNNYISNDGDNEGLSVNPGGEVSFSTTTGTAFTFAKATEALLMEMLSYGSGTGAGTFFDLYNARGTSGSKTAVQNGDRLFTIKSRAFYDPTNIVNNELMTMSVDGSVSTNIVPTRTDFQTVDASGTSNTVLSLRSDGTVGIGTTSTDSTLTVAGGINAEYIRLSGGAPTVGQVLTVTNTNGTAEWQNASVADNLGNHTATANIQLNGNYLSNDGDSEGIVVSNAGEVGVGTSAVSGVQMAVADQIRTINNGSGIQFANDQIEIRGNNSNSGDMIFETNNSTRMRIMSGGNVGINETNPSHMLDVGGSFSAQSINVNNAFDFPTADGTANQILQTNGSGTVSWVDGSSLNPWTEVIDTLYNTTKFFGIGTASPAARMSINQTLGNFGLEAVTNFNSSNPIIGIFGGATGSGSGFKYGGWFSSEATGSSQNVGAYAIVDNATTSSINIGFWGDARSQTGTFARGLEGDATGVGSNIGVWGSASGGTDNWAGYFNAGDVYINDNLGIGITNPSYPIHISSTGNTTARIDAAANNRAALQFAEVAGVFGTAATGFELAYNGADDKFMIRYANGGTIDTALTIDRSNNGYVGIHNHDPQATFDVNGAIKLDTVDATPVGGMIQWTGSDFQGYNGANWQSLTSSNSTCPAGMTAVGGNMCIETAERTASDWFDAASTCVGAGYKLPTWAEWYGAMANASVTDETDDWEWVSDGTSNTARKVGNGGLKNTANDDPDTGSEVFRCVYYLK